MPNQAQQTPATSIDPRTSVGEVSLAVADLGRSLAFYTQGFGLALLTRDAGGATLGAGGARLLTLTEQPGALPWPGRYAGLYHFAVLVPTRADLGRWLRHWLNSGFPMPGQGDHLVSEALYLSDPDGNGIEIYCDRPRSAWQWQDGRVRMASEPVDVAGVLAAGNAAPGQWEGLPAGTRLGHIHLQVGDIGQAAAFYHDVLGFDIVASLPSALFVSAGGYHHHIGMNTWQSRGASAAPPGVAGLRYFTIDLADSGVLTDVLARLDAAGVGSIQEAGGSRILDPWRNAIQLRLWPGKAAG